MLTEEDKKFYRDFHKVLSDPKFNDILVTHAKKEYTKAVNSVRAKQDTYDYGYCNGKADTWQNIIELKHKITEILKNIGA